VLPTKLLGEEVIHPAPQVFSVLFFQIFWATSHTLIIPDWCFISWKAPEERCF